MIDSGNKCTVSTHSACASVGLPTPRADRFATRAIKVSFEVRPAPQLRLFCHGLERLLPLPARRATPFEGPRAVGKGLPGQAPAERRANESLIGVGLGCGGTADDTMWTLEHLQLLSRKMSSGRISQPIRLYLVPATKSDRRMTSKSIVLCLAHATSCIGRTALGHRSTPKPHPTWGRSERASDIE
jgi:hypothetical protein